MGECVVTALQRGKTRFRAGSAVGLVLVGVDVRSLLPVSSVRPA